MRDVKGGWLLRYMHANGASMFFIVVHLYFFRGSYHESYVSPSKLVRCPGVVTLFPSMVTASMGYVLSRGPLHGATAGAIPIVGDTIVIWLWGG
jgi:ubiquinol-cytochrome c reductase cytochrome b subunit